jgi:PEP-CTERM motif.
MTILRNQHAWSLFVCLWLFTNPAWAASSSLNPSADAFVAAGPSGNLSNNNYGGAGALSIAAPNLSQGEFQSVVQFNLSSVKSAFDSQFGIGQWSIQSVTLQITAAAPNNAIFNSSAAGQFSISWMQNDGWTEGTGTPGAPTTTGITFSTLNTFLSPGDETLGTFNFNGATSGNSTYTLGLTPSFSADVLAGNTVSFRMFAADTAVSYLSDSRSFGTASARPLLTITAVPEPTSIAIALAGLCILARARSRPIC